MRSTSDSLKRHLRYVLLGVALLSVIAIADDPVVTLADFLKYNESVSFSAEIQPGEPTHTVIEVWREPLLGGTHRIRPAAKSKDTVETLEAIRYWVADDTNQNGVINSGEWVLVASANAVQEGEWRVARCQPVVVSAFKDAYRFETVWETNGVESSSYDTVLKSDLETE
jgi:hypothetical protein